MIQEIKITIGGSAGVGKSSILNRFLNDSFSNQYIPTFSDDEDCLVTIGSKQFRLNFIDTSGQEDFKENYERLSRGCDVLLLVFSTDLKESQDNVLHLAQQTNLPFLIVCNKIDLVTGQKYLIPEKILQICPDALTTSALNGQNIKKSIVRVVSRVSPVRNLNNPGFFSKVFGCGGIEEEDEPTIIIHK